MSKTKKMTFNMIAAKLNDGSRVTEVRIGDDIVLDVRYALDLKQALGLVADVVSACIDQASGEYTPEAFDLSLRVAIFSRYAGVEMPKDLNKAYQAVYNPEVYNPVLAQIDHNQLALLADAAKQRILFMRDMLVSTAAGRMNDMIAKMENVMKDGEKVVDAVSSGEFIEAMSQLRELTKLADGEDMGQEKGGAETADDAPETPAGGRNIVTLPWNNG